MDQRPMRRDAARNREKLLDNAGEVFAAEGLDASLEEIARRAGVSIGTLYNHFPKRGDLIEAVIPHRLSAIDTLAEIADAEPDPRQALIGFIAGMLQRQSADRGLREALSGAHHTTEALTQACQRGMRQLSHIMRRARDAGAVRPDLTETELINLVWSLSMLGEMAGGEAARRCLDLVMDGIGTPEPTGR